MVMAKKTSKCMDNFFIKKHTLEETSIISSELALIYHNVKHSLSYNSLDCLAKNISKFIPDSQIAAKMTCGRTKASAITRNVLGPYSQEKVISELKECNYFSVASDASNVGNLKTFPYAVQYFDCNKGIRRKLLDFYEEAEETSLDIYKCLKKITIDSNLSMDQISAYSADNASVNYGAHNSVFQKLKEENNHIFKANCYCHVINNCVKYALKGLDVDIESIVIKIYNEFSSSALKTKKLKECCEFAQIEYKELLRHVPTRWLSLLPAIDRLIRSWPAVKHYFLAKGEDNCHKVLWDFISEGCSSTDFINNDEECKKEGKNDCYLFFLSNILSEFTKLILHLESESFTILDIDHAMRNLHDQLKSRMADNFFGSKVRDIFRKLAEEERALFTGQVHIFLQRALKYLEERYDFSTDGIYKKFELLSLKSQELKLTWEVLSELPTILNIEDAVNIDSLYAEFACLKTVYKELPKDLPNDEIWAYFFRNNTSTNFDNLKKIVGFVLSIPTSNAFCERIFSLLNSLWTKERNRMSMDLIKSELQTRINFDVSCSEILSVLQSSDGEKLIKMAKSSEKYLKK